MSRLTAEARQKFGERRRAMKGQDGIEERLVEVGKGEWKLEYWKGKMKTDELLIN